MAARQGNLGILIACYLLFLEGLSWYTASFPPCLIESPRQQQTAENNQKKDCATFGAGSIILLGKLDHFIEAHDKSIVAGFTIVLAISTIGLWLATNKLWQAGERQMDLIAANAAQQSADMQKSIAVAQEEFRSAHRPLLRLKHMWLASQEGQSTDGQLRAGVPIFIKLDFVNVGTSNAIMTVINFVTVLLVRDTKLPQRPPYNEPGVGKFYPNLADGGAPVEPGVTSYALVSNGCVLSEIEIDDIINGIQKLYFIGTVEYWDAGRKLRQTAFCRRLSYETVDGLSARVGRFIKVDDPDYEYQD